MAGAVVVAVRARGGAGKRSGAGVGVEMAGSPPEALWKYGGDHRQLPGQRARQLDHRSLGEHVTTVLYPGSFDPFHNGHRELVETASYLFDRVIIAAMRNPQKGEPLFELGEREDMIQESLAHLDNVRVMHFAKLVVDVAKDIGADFIVK